MLIKDESPTEKMGLIIPDNAKAKPNTGKIISVGSLVLDKKIKKDRTAIFNAQAGFNIELENVTITVLNQAQVLGVC